MASVSAVLPPYCTPRNEWRKLIHKTVTEVVREQGVTFNEAHRFEIIVELFLSESAMNFHDVDNRLKDVCDALQGRVGGPKKIRTLPAIIPNDRQIIRATISKRTLSPGELMGGRLIINWRA